jgi:rubrerythrin
LTDGREGAKPPPPGIRLTERIHFGESFSNATASRPAQEDMHMATLKASKTHENLKSAFAGESQANRRYLYFAKQADVEGRPDIAGLFRDTAEGETGHAHGHLEYLQEVGDPATGEPIGDSEKNLKAAVAGETYEYTQMYPGFARQARDEGFDEIAEWFETLAKAEKSHAGRFAKGLQQVKAEG